MSVRTTAVPCKLSFISKHANEDQTKRKQAGGQAVPAKVNVPDVPSQPSADRKPTLDNP